ncbi:MAG: hypothetical protein ACK5L5_08125 [Bacteroidales bacterium]
MKNIFRNLFSIVLLLVISSCDNYFETNPDRLINDSDYISEENDMYTGYMGIATKMQAMADDMILRSDIRANYLEPNAISTQDIVDLYNYNNSQNNQLADPAGFYDVILAANDYMTKMKAYREKIGDAMSDETTEDFEGMIGGALRFKAWAYYKLANLYGEFIYFDDPIKEAKDLTDASVFTHLTDYDAMIQKCLDIIDYGYPGLEGIDGSKALNWGRLMNPEDIDAESTYRIWYRSTPDYVCLRSDLLLASNSPDYAWIKDKALTYIYDNLKDHAWSLGTNNNYQNAYPAYFSARKGTSICVSAVIYDGYYDQVNSLYDYFVGEKYVRGSQWALKQYTSNDGVLDKRRASNLYWSMDGDSLCTKYYGGMYNTSRNEIRYRSISRGEFPNDAAIPLYRTQDLHFFLIEACNHLGDWDISKTLLMGGINAKMAATGLTSMEITAEEMIANEKWGVQWADSRWLNKNWEANRGLNYDNNNSDGTYYLPVPVKYGGEDDLTEEERMKAYDYAIMHEYMLEYVAEGKVMDMFTRMMHRYSNDAEFINSVADLITAKYPEGEQEAIKAKVIDFGVDGQYYINWDLYGVAKLGAE